MTQTEKLIEHYIKLLENHPAMKFANAEIMFNAFRTGTKGYTGTENLNGFIAKIVPEIMDIERQQVLEDILVEISNIFPDWLDTIIVEREMPNDPAEAADQVMIFAKRELIAIINNKLPK